MLKVLSRTNTSVVKLCDVAELNPRLREKPALDTNVSFVPMAAVSSETGAVFREEIRPYRDVAKGFTVFENGDVLVAKITPCFENNKIAQANLSLPLGFGSTEFHVVRARRDELDSRYLFHFLRQDHVRSDGARRMTGSAGQRRVPEHFLSDLDLCLPPLPEQRRIAAILDQADTLRAKRREALAKLDEMAQATFQKACSTAETGRSGLYLANFLAEIQIGPFGSLLHKSDYVEGGVPLVNPMHINDGQIVPSTAYSVSEKKLKDLARYQLQEGDIVMGRRGEMGRCAVARLEHVGMLCGTGSMILRCDPKKAAPDFLAEFIRSPHIVQALENASSGVTMANLNQKSLSAIEANLPPVDIQERYAETNQRFRSEKKRMQGAMETLNSLFNSLQHRAFSEDL